jgi:hypothetical protein
MLMINTFLQFTPIDWGAIVTQMPSIAMALLFAAFAKMLIESNQVFTKNQTDIWADRYSQRDKDWQEFMSLQQEEWRKTIESLAQTHKEIRAMQQNDSERIIEMLKDIQKLLSATKITKTKTQ